MSIHNNSRQRKMASMTSPQAPASSHPRLWIDARLATLAPDRPGVGVIERGAIAAKDGRIVFVGAESELPSAIRAESETIPCDGRWITPGLTDCHTHLVYARDPAA